MGHGPLFPEDDSDYEDDLPYFSSRAHPRHRPHSPNDIDRFDVYGNRRRPGLPGLSWYYDPYRDDYDDDSVISRIYDDDCDSDFMSPFSQDDFFYDYGDPFFRSRRRSRFGRGRRH
ncbi:MAG: hypothetical protein M1821_008124 [Bathelium mastoideum]|nr:MAG: hypothetical protein M1821_008124 [Bathelium mastoideum]KAI9693166.1 MAG: hypothetical protein M1822_005162 [Bathelium mastoideum]